MGTAIAVRTDFSSQKLRRLATRVKDAAQARRLLAIAAVLDSAAREEAAKIGGMDRQTLRDWVIRTCCATRAATSWPMTVSIRAHFKRSGPQKHRAHGEVHRAVRDPFQGAVEGLSRCNISAGGSIKLAGKSFCRLLTGTARPRKTRLRPRQGRVRRSQTGSLALAF